MQLLSSQIFVYYSPKLFIEPSFILLSHVGSLYHKEQCLMLLVWLLIRMEQEVIGINVLDSPFSSVKV